MGTGFMIDAPLRVAKFGISSVISLVDDVLIEQMRQFHCRREGEPYEEIAGSEEDSRARRITAYLDLLDRLVRRQVAALQASPFEPGSEITRYYEMLPEGPLADEYREMLAVGDAGERALRQDRLRGRAVPGSIDVNIMAKGDRDAYRDGEKLPLRFSDASAALRGFAQSTLASSIVFSAGMNPRMYGYAAEFPDFFPDDRGRLKKKIVLKVSDFHSAAVQGKFLAKRGLWVSEYRVESGLNCGGHAFATKGLLLGPILDEFQRKRGELVEQLHAVYAKAMLARGRAVGAAPLAVRITAQGGIGTADEDRLLREFYDVDGTGWGTPFLLVPEVTNVDDEHLQKLCRRERRRRLSQRQLAVRFALLEPAHLGERGSPATPHCRGPAGKPLLEGLLQTVQRGIHPHADLHGIAGIPEAQTGAARRHGLACGAPRGDSGRGFGQVLHLPRPGRHGDAEERH